MTSPITNFKLQIKGNISVIYPAISKKTNDKSEKAKQSSKNPLNYEWKCLCSSNGPVYFTDYIRCPSCCSKFSDVFLQKSHLCLLWNFPSYAKTGSWKQSDMFQVWLFHMQKYKCSFQDMASKQPSNWNPQCSFANLHTASNTVVYKAIMEITSL